MVGALAGELAGELASALAGELAGELTVTYLRRQSGRLCHRLDRAGHIDRSARFASYLNTRYRPCRYTCHHLTEEKYYIMQRHKGS